MKIFHVFVRDTQLGDEIAVSTTKRRRALSEQTKLRKTFIDVKVRPGKLLTGYNEPEDLKKDM
jgi:hypothetical protein